MTRPPNAAEREFDSSLMAEVGKWRDGHMSGMSSPDGLKADTGRWWLIHSCPDPRTFTPNTEDGKAFANVTACRTCGQRYEHVAYGSDFDHPDVQWTFAAHMKRRFPPDGTPPESWTRDDE